MLSVRSLRFTYTDADRPALASLSFDLSPGDLLAVMGASGAGKSTLCRCLNGLIPRFLGGDFTGRVRVLDQDVSRLRVSEAARTVGLVFQDFESQLFATNVELEVAFAAESLGLPRPEIARRVGQLLSFVGLSHLRHRRPASLSGGEKQRLAIAAALASAPPLLVLDEATSDLDPAGKSAVFSLARHLSTESTAARAVVFAHHDAEEALHATQVLLLDRGKPVAFGPPQEVLADPQRLSSHGIMPLAAAALFQQLDLGDPPFGDAAAADLLLRRGLHIPDSRAEHWASQEQARANSYGDNIIEVRGLTHRYHDGDPAVENVNLTLRRGEYVAIIGQNGSGKTTLVKHFNGLLPPTAGDVFLSGSSVQGQSLRSLGHRVGYVFQNPDHQIFASTVFDEVAFAPRNFGCTTDEVAQRVAESLAAVGLTRREKEDPFSLTKGERQRVAVASVLAGRPEVLIFDEPTTGLDYRESLGMMALIDRLNRHGHTIVLVTHAMWLVAQYAHRVIVMQQGRIALDSPTRAAFAHTDLLRSAAIIPPQVVRLSQPLGATALTIPELVAALQTG
jgi:energy-coupling factor transporter ATP-binding protein EcfA2